MAEQRRGVLVNDARLQSLTIHTDSVSGGTRSVGVQAPQRNAHPHPLGRDGTRCGNHEVPLPKNKSFGRGKSDSRRTRSRPCLTHTPDTDPRQNRRREATNNGAPDPRLRQTTNTPIPPDPMTRPCAIEREGAGPDRGTGVKATRRRAQTLAARTGGRRGRSPRQARMSETRTALRPWPAGRGTIIKEFGDGRNPQRQLFWSSDAVCARKMIMAPGS